MPPNFGGILFQFSKIFLLTQLLVFYGGGSGDAPFINSFPMKQATPFLIPTPIHYSPLPYLCASSRCKTAKIFTMAKAFIPSGKNQEKSSAAFGKFANPKVGGAKLKEQLKQEKKTATKARREAIEAHFEKKRQEKAAQYQQRIVVETNNPNQQKAPFKKGDNKLKPRPVKTFEPPAQRTKIVTDNTRPTKPAAQKESRPIKSASNINDKHPKQFVKQHKPTEANSESFPEKNKIENNHQKHARPFERKVLVPNKTAPEKRPIKKVAPQKTDSKKADFDKPTPFKNEMPLNKFIAHAGVCARRDAAELVKSGKVTVDGKIITEPGFKVTDHADVKVEGKKLHRSKNLVYILLNKPKDFITTSEDTHGRKTVMDIVKNATQERVYPIGRLDRNTSGVLILTNDGDLAQQLSHPSFGVKKLYEVRLDKPVAKTDFDKIINGIVLEDGPVHVDSLAYADAKDKSVIGIEIHSGRNRIVRRIFEHLGYDVRNLDRVMYANLTKKNVERGKWRFLSDKEVRLLKYFKSGGKK